MLPRLLPREVNMKLTDRQVKNLKPKLQRYEVWEGNGFGIRIFPTGRKSWVFMYRFEGKARRLTFGNYPQISVAEAHAAYGKALADLEKGVDAGASLVTANKENRLAPTVNNLITEYLEKWAKPRKRSWKEDERILRKDVALYLGNRKAKDIKKREIISLLRFFFIVVMIQLPRLCDEDIMPLMLVTLSAWAGSPNLFFTFTFIFIYAFSTA